VSRIYLLSLPLVFLSVFLRMGFTDSSPLTDIHVVNESRTISWQDMLVDSVGISAPAIRLAFEGYQMMKQQNQLNNDSLIAIIDFSKPSIEKRFYLLDLRNQRVVKNTLVAHGKNSGMLTAESFSNTIHSNQSSLGLYITQNTYQGKHGYSLRIQGMSKGLNDNAMKRAVVIHGADYVSKSFIERNGRLGRSYGCPALPIDDTQEVIDLIKNGACLFIYHPSLLSKSPADFERL
jgi:hypothetical protein